MTDKIVLTLLVNTAVFSVLLCAMLLIRKAAGKRMSPFLMLILWAVIAVKLIIPFGFESSISIMPPAAAIENQQYVYNKPSDSMPGTYSNTDNNISADSSNTTAVDIQAEKSNSVYADAASSGRKAAPAVSWTVIALAVWCAGIAAVTVGLCMSAANIKRRIRHSSIATPQSIIELTEECKAVLGIRRSVGVITQSAIGKPVITGALRPLLILPETSPVLEAEALRHVLLHELTHLKHGDLWLIRILNILRALYWFNPLVWLCFRLIREDMETACDQSVIRILGECQRLSYIATVLRFAQQVTIRNSFAAAIGLFDGRPAFERRIKRMYGKTKTGLKGRITAAFVALLIFSLSALTACQPAAADSSAPQGKQDTWQYTKQYESGSSLNVHATVNSVDADSLATLTVAPKAFENGDEMKSIINSFARTQRSIIRIRGAMTLTV